MKFYFPFQTFKGSPEEEGSPLTIPVDPKFVPLKELNIKMTVLDEDDEKKELKAIDVQVKGCQLGKLIKLFFFLIVVIYLF